MRPWQVGDHATFKWNKSKVIDGKIVNIEFHFRTDDPYVTLKDDNGKIKHCLLSQVSPTWKTRIKWHQMKHDLKNICLDEKIRPWFTAFVFMGIFYSALLIILSFGKK